MGEVIFRRGKGSLPILFLHNLEAIPEILTEGNLIVAQSCLTLCDPMDSSPPGSSVNGILQANHTGVGCHSLSGIFPTQGSNPDLLHCRKILYNTKSKKHFIIFLFMTAFVIFKAYPT